MTTPRFTHRSWRRAATLVAAGAIALGLNVTIAAPAHASLVDWVDGGDEYDCLNDDVGAALTRLADDKQCQPIPGCYIEADGTVVLPSRSTGIWQDASRPVKYADELVADPEPGGGGTATPKPNSPKPVTPKPTTPKKTTGGKSTTKTTKTPKTTTTASGRNTAKKPTTTTKTSKPTGTTTQSTKTPTGVVTPQPRPQAAIDEVTGGGEDEVVAAGAPTAPSAPVTVVDGSSITVTWEPTADAELESVTGYVLRFSGQDPVTTDAETTEYTFEDLPDGTYRAAVRAVNEAGESVSSPPSEPTVIGTPVTDIVGELLWAGDLFPGAAVEISGRGYAPGATFDIELHSDPVWLGSFTTDNQGRFAADVAIPTDIPEGDHTLVIAYDGTVVSETPVTVGAAEPEETLTAIDAEAPSDVAAPILSGTETVPPLTGLVILAALAAAGVLSLTVHAARRGRTGATPAAAVAVAAGAGQGSGTDSTRTEGSVANDIAARFRPAEIPVLNRTPTTIGDAGPARHRSGVSS